MRNQDLIAVARKCRVVTRFRNTIGLPGTMAVRLQPNHPTDDPVGIAAPNRPTYLRHLLVAELHAPSRGLGSTTGFLAFEAYVRRRAFRPLPVRVDLSQDLSRLRSIASTSVPRATTSSAPNGRRGCCTGTAAGIGGAVTVFAGCGCSVPGTGGAAGLPWWRA